MFVYVHTTCTTITFIAGNMKYVMSMKKSSEHVQARSERLLYTITIQFQYHFSHHTCTSCFSIIFTIHISTIFSWLYILLIVDLSMLDYSQEFQSQSYFNHNLILPVSVSYYILQLSFHNNT